MFYPVEGIVLEQGDWLAARCVMNNTKNVEVKIGPTKNDEMCNL